MTYYGTKTKVFVSFDFDHDQDLKHLFCGQAEHDDTPFSISDISIKKEVNGDWENIARQRIKRADQVVVICGEHTHTASGVSREIEIAKEESKPYFLLRGRSSVLCTTPRGVRTTDQMYRWTWDNVASLLRGNR